MTEAERVYDSRPWNNRAMLDPILRACNVDNRQQESIMATQTKKPTAANLVPPITVQQWGELEGPPHYELVDGRLQEKPDVAIWHDFFLMGLIGVIDPFVRKSRLGQCAGATSKIQISEFHGRQPDFFFIPRALFHLVGQNLFKGVPPMAAEIVSPNYERTDRVVKFREYAEFGIGQYWIIDCRNRRLEVYILGPGDAQHRTYQLSEVVEGDVIFRPSVFPGLEISLGELWPTEFLDSTDD